MKLTCLSFAAVAALTSLGCGVADQQLEPADPQAAVESSVNAAPQIRTTRFEGEVPIGNDSLRVSATLEYTDLVEVFDVDTGFNCDLTNAFTVKIHLVATNRAGTVLFEGDRQGEVGVYADAYCRDGLMFPNVSVSADSFRAKVGGVALEVGTYGTLVIRGGSLKMQKVGRNAFVSGYDPASLRLTTLNRDFLSQSGPGTVPAEIPLARKSSSVRPAPALFAVPAGVAQTRTLAGEIPVGSETLRVSATLRYLDAAEAFPSSVGSGCELGELFPVDLHLVATNRSGTVLFEGDRVGRAYASKSGSCTGEHQVSIATASFLVRVGSAALEIGGYQTLLLRGGNVTLNTLGRNHFVTGFNPTALTLSTVLPDAPRGGAPGLSIPFDISLVRQQ